MRKKLFVTLMCVCMAASAVSCGKSDDKKENTTTTTQAVNLNEDQEEEENYNTGDASLDKVRNEDGMGENELLVVSFGTSYNDNRRLTIGAIEQRLEDEFGKDYSVRRGFTSQIIIDHVKRRDNVTIDNVKEALDRASNNGVKKLVVQPTHLMNGLEYKDVVDEIAKVKKNKMDKPLEDVVINTIDTDGSILED